MPVLPPRPLLLDYVTFQLPVRDEPQTTVLDQAPLVVTQSGAQQVVVLRSPREPERLTVVRERLAPFALDPETKARLLAQASGQRT